MPLQSGFFEVLNGHAIFYEFIGNGVTENRQTPMCLKELQKAPSHGMSGFGEVPTNGNTYLPVGRHSCECQKETQTQAH